MVQSGQTTSKTQKPFDVFVSHSSKDGDKAAAIVEALELSGVRCWIAPRNILPGSQYGESIVEGIENSEIMVLVFSQHANQSPQITREVERAAHHGIRIIPFRIENVPPSKNLEYFISSPHWLDAYSGVFTAHLAYLTKTVQHLLGRSSSEGIPARSSSLNVTVPHSAAEIIPSLKKLAAGLFGLIISLTAALSKVISKTTALLLAALNKFVAGLNAILNRLPGILSAAGRILPPTTALLQSIFRQWKLLIGSALLFSTIYIGYKWVTLSPLESTLIGRWQMSIPGVPLIGLPVVHSSGKYELILAYQEAGMVEIRSGSVYLLPKGGFERKVEWEPGAEGSVDAQLIPDEFWSLAARLTPDKSQELEALRLRSTKWIQVTSETRPGMRKWTIVPLAGDLPWTFLFETGPAAQYRLRAVQNDDGKIKTEGNTWSMSSEKTGNRSGEFELVDENTVNLNLTIGKSILKRQLPAAGS